MGTSTTTLAATDIHETFAEYVANPDDDVVWLQQKFSIECPKVG